MMIIFLIKLILWLLPISLTPLWGYLIADGHLNFGGGEKDLFLLIPWMVWSFLYMLIFIIGWIRRIKVKLILLYSICGATGILVLGGIILFIFANDILGIYKGQ
ncbi:hypothetical protein ACFL2O_10990 [Thermodesulfobacteriota bacterium]